MAAASVMSMSSLDTLPPSALTQHSPRHGRSRAASMKKGNRYHVQENRDNAIAKAVSFVLKRAVTQTELEEESEDDEEDEDETDDRLVSSDDGWVALPELLQQSRISDLEASLPDLKRISNKSKARFELRQKPGSDAEKAESYQIRNTHKRDSMQAPIEGEPLQLDSEGLPDFVVYETSYEAYPHILASDGIQKAAGANYSTFSPIAADGSEVRPNRTSDADVGIWVHLRTALETEPSIVWQRTASGAIVTANEVPKGLWKKAVARRQDIGVLFEDGEVRKEVPEALRGKGSKGKAKKAKNAFLKSRGGDEASDSASDE